MTRWWTALGELPAPVRHLILVALAAVATWATDATPTPGELRMAVAAAVLAVLTPLVQSYGARGDGDPR